MMALSRILRHSVEHGSGHRFIGVLLQGHTQRRKANPMRTVCSPEQREFETLGICRFVGAFDGAQMATPTSDKTTSCDVRVQEHELTGQEAKGYSPTRIGRTVSGTPRFLPGLQST